MGVKGFFWFFGFFEILVLLLLGWSPMVEGKLHVGTCSISLRVKAGSMTSSYCSNCRRVCVVYVCVGNDTLSMQ
jgi:hypothetical protein